jgi:purine-binding chemotaxis protein CheW
MTSEIAYLTFTVGQTECAVELSAVQELKVWEGVSKLPLAAPYVLGAMNLRGEIVPVIDLLYRLENHSAQIGPRAVVVLCRLKSGKIIGALVETVKDVRALPDNCVQEIPDGLGYPIGLVRGLATLPDEILIVVDPEHLLEAQRELN